MNNRGDVAVMIVCGLSLLAVMTVVQAQGFADPTRPPATIDRPVTAVAATPGEPDAAAAGLQTIIRGRTGKPAAVINGEYVLLGGRIGDARLVKIGEDSVTLKSSAGLETLKLMPGIEKVPVAADGEKAAKKTVKEKSVGAGVGK